MCQTFVPGALIAQVEFLMPMKKTAKILKQRQAKGQLHCSRSVADSAKAGIGRHVQTGTGCFMDVSCLGHWNCHGMYTKIGQIAVIFAYFFVVFSLQAAASGSDSATTLEERAP